ncbi:MAG: hypothetical protein JWR76_1106 [Mucilaginibacter sp.]|nr:hypothetical protein [Mucilaginibacter sp.]
MPETVPPASVINYLLAGALKQAPAVAVVKVPANHRVMWCIGRILSGGFNLTPGPKRLVKNVQVFNGAVNALIAHGAI